MPLPGHDNVVTYMCDLIGQFSLRADKKAPEKIVTAKKVGMIAGGTGKIATHDK